MSRKVNGKQKHRKYGSKYFKRKLCKSNSRKGDRGKGKAADKNNDSHAESNTERGKGNASDDVS
jgi:hypothetical protein